MSFCSASVKFRCEEAKGKAGQFKSVVQRLHNSGFPEHTVGKVWKVGAVHLMDTVLG